MTQRFIVRVLDASSALLAWAEVFAQPKPQERGASCPFWPTGPTQFVVTQAGLATEVSIHWADLDVARRQALLEPVHVAVGQVFTFAWIEPVWLVPGMRDVPLPPVTVGKPVAVRVPVGSIGAVTGS
jgi:hypothetical protein